MKQVLSYRRFRLSVLIRGLCIAALAAVMLAGMAGCHISLSSPDPGSGGNSASHAGSASGSSDLIHAEKAESMPDLTNLKKEDAIKILADMGLSAKITEIETTNAAEGCVFSHVPTAGKSVKSGGEVTLYIAKKKSDAKSANSDSGKKTSSTVYLYCIASDFVSLRAKPDVDSKELIKIPSRDGMIYLNEKSGSWYRVRYGDFTGYVYEDYVSFDQGSDIVYENNTMYCTARDFVALRADANVKSREILRIPRGDSMQYLNSRSGKWYFVQYGSKRGYVYGDYVSFDPGDIPSASAPAAKTARKTLYCTARDYVALRADANVKSREILRIPCGDSMQYLDSKSGKWYFVQYGSKRGYVYGDYVSFDKSDVPSVGTGYSPDTDSPDYLYCTALDFVSLRADPDVDSAEFARIPHGAEMVYLKSKSGHWYFVQYGAKKGYVYDKYVSFDPGDI